MRELDLELELEELVLMLEELREETLTQQLKQPPMQRNRELARPVAD